MHGQGFGFAAELCAAHEVVHAILIILVVRRTGVRQSGSR